jgi:hypothetical protein
MCGSASRVASRIQKSGNDDNLQYLDLHKAGWLGPSLSLYVMTTRSRFAEPPTVVIHEYAFVCIMKTWGQDETKRTSLYALSLPTFLIKRSEEMMTQAETLQS